MANRFDNFFEMSGTLIADLQGGYAVSKDNGENWTWYGGSTYGNIVTDGTNLVRLNDDLIGVKPRLIQLSSDKGENWETLFNGLPDFTGQANFNSFGDVYAVNGKIYIEATGSDERKLMELDAVNKKWIETEKKSTLPSRGILTYLADVDGVLFASLNSEGVYELSGQSGFVARNNSLFKLFPNPTSERINIEGSFNFKSARILNLLGQEVLCVDLNGRKSIDVSILVSGIYLLQISDGQQQYTTKFSKH